MSDPYFPILAVDDGYFPPIFKAGRGETVLVGILYDNYPLDMLIRTIRVDGDDATSTILDMLAEAKPKTLMLDNVIYAGFNYVDIGVLEKEFNTPIIVIIKHKVRPEAILKALKKHFPDWRRRWQAIGPPIINSKKISTTKGKLIIHVAGIELKEAADITSRLQIYSRIPEPLRIADMAASALSREILKTQQHKATKT